MYYLIFINGFNGLMISELLPGTLSESLRRGIGEVVTPLLFQRGALYPTIVVAHHILMIQPREQLNLAGNLLVQLLILGVELDALYGVTATVQLVLNLNFKH